MKIDFDTVLFGLDGEPLPKPLSSSERETLATLLEAHPNTPSGGNERALLARLMDKTGTSVEGFDRDRKMTVADGVKEALQLELQGETATMDEKVARFRLARKVEKGGVRVVAGVSNRLSLTTAEVELIRTRVGKTCKTWIAGQIKDAIDGEQVEAEPSDNVSAIAS